jgi:hypothetical protein
MEVKIKGHKSMAPQQHPQKLNIVLPPSLSRTCLCTTGAVYEAKKRGKNKA